MKTLWIHAGFPKNGSSALQVFFAKNRNKLLDEDVDYLEISDLDRARQGKITSGNAAKLARTLLPEMHEAFVEDNDQVYSKFLDALSCSHSENIVISSEFFPFAKKDAISQLISDSDALGCRVKLLFYVRRQDQFLMSGYMQRVKRHGYTGGPSDFVCDRIGKNPLLDYYSCSKKFSDIYGFKNIFPFVFDVVEKHPQGLFGHAIETISGRRLNWVGVEDVVNTSPSPVELKLLLMANRYSPRSEFSDLLIESSVSAGRSKIFSLHNLLPIDVVKKISEHYEEQNKKFVTHYCLGGRFQDYGSEEFVDIDNLSFTPNEVMDIVSGLLVNFDRRLCKIEDR